MSVEISSLTLFASLVFWVLNFLDRWGPMKSIISAVNGNPLTSVEAKLQGGEEHAGERPKTEEIHSEPDHHARSTRR